MALTSKYFWQSKVLRRPALTMHFNENRYSERSDLELLGSYSVRVSAALRMGKRGYQQTIDDLRKPVEKCGQN